MVKGRLSPHRPRETASVEAISNPQARLKSKIASGLLSAQPLAMTDGAVGCPPQPRERLSNAQLHAMTDGTATTTRPTVDNRNPEGGGGRPRTPNFAPMPGTDRCPVPL